MEKNIQTQEEMKIQEKEYMESLSDFEKEALITAKDLLGETYDMFKSNGFLQWKKEKYG
jgi:hypothetical protein